jgi:alpha-glucosidase (family GH31 glycosyl hydrolase)
MQKENFTLLLIILCLFFNTQAQIITAIPANPSTDDSVTIIYNAALGNAALNNFQGPIYMHSGVITPSSNGPNDWKFISTQWGNADTNALMTNIGSNLWRKKYHIRSFYNIPQNEQVLRLAFVFRNQNGSLVGRSETNNDIFYDINLTTLNNYTSHQFVNGVLKVFSGNQFVEINAVTPKIFKVSYLSNSMPFGDSSYAVIHHQVHPTAVLNQPNALILATSQAQVIINKNPVRLRFVVGNDTLSGESSGYYEQFTEKGISLQLDATEKLYGGGFSSIFMDRRGKRIPLFNRPMFGYGFGGIGMNINIPYVVSNKGYAYFFDNYSTGFLDLGQQIGNQLKFHADDGTLRYYFIAGQDMAELTENYTLLTGRQPLPPRWSLGYIQSKYGYETQQEAQNMVNQMRQKNFPLDVLILDLFWFGSPATMGNFNWDNSRFPTPVNMMNNFKSRGIKTVLITETYFTTASTNFNFGSTNHYFGKRADGSTYVINGFWAGNSALLDMTRKSARDWFWNLYVPRINEGVDGWWCDLGEPESHPADMIHFSGPSKKQHNVYSLIWAELLHRKYAENYPNQRLFNLIRSGWAGLQRYSTFPWSGDVQRSNDGLKGQIPISLSMGLCGIPFMHNDLGGFVGGGQDDILYSRWLQLGAFFPIMRAHGSGNVPPEPYNYSTNTQNLVRSSINLRYRLLPYNYHLAYEAATIGQPLMRPMNYYHINNQALSDINTQFYWGKNLIVADLIESQNKITLPSGKWFVFEGNQSFNGNQIINYPITNSNVGVMAKAGSFIPTTRTRFSTDSYNMDSLITYFYNDLSVSVSNFDLYHDDGKNPNALATNNFEMIKYTGETFSDSILIDLEKTGTFIGAPSQRFKEFILINSFGSDTPVVYINGVQQILHSTNNYGNQSSGYQYTYQQIRFKFIWDGSIQHIVIKKGISKVNPPTSLANNEIKSGMMVYPNPAKDIVHITAASKYNEQGVMSIINLSGKELQSENIILQQGLNAFKMHIEKLSRGIYLLRINTEKQQITERIIIQ